MSAQQYDRVVRTVCSPNCMSSCGVNAFVRDDRIVKLEPGYYPDPRFQRICGRGIAMANRVSFSHIEYRGCGNEVVGTVVCGGAPVSSRA